jgi:hypothetical protein
MTLSETMGAKRDKNDALALLVRHDLLGQEDDRSATTNNDRI